MQGWMKLPAKIATSPPSVRTSHRKMHSVQGENLGPLAQEQQDHLRSGKRQWADTGTQNTMLCDYLTDLK